MRDVILLCGGKGTDISRTPPNVLKMAAVIPRGVAAILDGAAGALWRPAVD